MLPRDRSKNCNFMKNYLAPYSTCCKPEDRSSQSEFRFRIERAKEILALPQLIEELGDSERVAENRCPFHFPDVHPSFSVFAHWAGELWKCHAGCGAGDQITYLEVKFQIPRGEAILLFLEMAGLSSCGGGRFVR